MSIVKYCFGSKLGEIEDTTVQSDSKHTVPQAPASWSTRTSTELKGSTGVMLPPAHW